MRRRDFIKLIGGAASVWPLTAHAQPDGKRPTIGFLGASSDSAWTAQVSSFNQRLRELGWVDGRTVSIVYRWAEGKLLVTPILQPSSSNLRSMLLSLSEAPSQL